MDIMSTRCPVCWKSVVASTATGRVWRHNDKAGHLCPMTGRHLPTEIDERRAS